MRINTVLLSLLFVCVTLTGAQAQQSGFAASLQAMRAGLQANDLAGAATQARAILKLAAETEAAQLTGTDMYAIGAAHMVLGSATMQQALRAGGLDAEQQQNATELAAMFVQPGEQPTATPPEGIVKVIGKGEEVVLEDHLVAGKTNIVDFYSDFCGPCRTLAPRLEALAKQREDLAVIKVDINRPGQAGIDWQSPTARQFSLRSIPHLRIYGPDGKLELEGRPAFERVLLWCQEAQ